VHFALARIIARPLNVGKVNKVGVHEYILVDIQMVMRKPRTPKINIREVYFKLLEAARREYPNYDEKNLNDIAAKRTNTWTSFIRNPDSGMPLLTLFAALGELSNLRVSDVRVSYPSQPFVDVNWDFKGRRRSSYLTYDEALSELKFALENDVVGAEKLRNTIERLEAEMIDTRKVRKVGNSFVVSVPESIISLFGLSDGDYLSFIYRFGEVKVKKGTAESQD
jgi:antitoxin MazE